jgi:hypothetical protein
MSLWRKGVSAVTDYLWRRNLGPLGWMFAVIVIALPLSIGTKSVFCAGWMLPRRSTNALVQVIGQDDESDENEVSTDDIEKYVSVYKAMQRKRTLTVDQAAAAQGLTTEQFRQLENRIERDDAALQQARDELEAAAKASPAANVYTRPAHQ